MAINGPGRSTQVASSATPLAQATGIPALPMFIPVVLVALYLWASWGFVAIWWGDYGLWLHQVSRAASGETPVKDFPWQYPPLAIYLLGAVATVVGDSLQSIRLVMAVVSVGIFAAYFLLVRRVVPPTLVVPVFVAGFLLAVAYSAVESETLAAGMYSPSMPLGGLFTLSAAAVHVRGYASLPALSSVAIGLLTAAAILSKQDFWIPALCIVSFAAFSLRRRRGYLVALAASFVGCLALGVGLVIVDGGWRSFLLGLGALNMASEQFGRALPSWERLVGQFVLLGGWAWAMVVCLSEPGSGSQRRLARATWWLAGGTALFASVYVAATMAADGTSILSATGILAQQLRLQALPLLAAPLTLVWLLVRRRSRLADPRAQLVLFLVCVATAARSRRLFEHIEWYNVMLEVPALVALIHWGWPTAAARVAPRIVGVLLAFGAFSFVDWTLGPPLNLPAIGRPAWGPATPVETVRGRVWLPELDAKGFMEVERILDRIDPARTAPVFAVGYQGPWSYFTGRRNPTPLALGFFPSDRDPEAVIGMLMDARPIVIDTASVHEPGGAIHPRVAFNQWRLSQRDHYHLRVDMRWYQRILAHCERVAEVTGRFETWTVYRWRP